jgi:hypothetical protein
MRRNPGRALPLAERFWFVAERGTAGWVKSASEPVLWCLWDESGLWRLSDTREIDPDSWVLPYCQFKLNHCFWAWDDKGKQGTYVRKLALFPPTPRRGAPSVVAAVAPRLPVREQLAIPF